jgi:hypothetical protein
MKDIFEIMLDTLREYYTEEQLDKVMLDMANSPAVAEKFGKQTAMEYRKQKMLSLKTKKTSIAEIITENLKGKRLAQSDNDIFPPKKILDINFIPEPDGILFELICESRSSNFCDLFSKLFVIDE